MTYFFAKNFEERSLKNLETVLEYGTHQADEKHRMITHFFVVVANKEGLLRRVRFRQAAALQTVLCHCIVCSDVFKELHILEQAFCLLS